MPSTRLNRSVRLAVVAAAAIGLIGAAAAPPVAPGVTYRIRMTTKLPDVMSGMGAGAPLAMAKAQFIGTRGRIDFTAIEGFGQTGTPPNQYLLVSDSGVVAVDPDSGTYTEGAGIAAALALGLDGRGAGLGGMGGGRRGGGRGGNPGNVGGGNAGGGNAAGGRQGRGGGGDRPGLQIHSINRLGPSDTIDNRPTDHYRLNISYIMQAGPSANPVSMESTLDIWTAKLGYKLFNPFDTFGSESRPTSGPLVELMAKLAAARRQIQGEPIRISFAVPLGNVITGLIGSGAGLGGGAPVQGFDLVQTTTITGITPTDVNPRTLTIPTGYVKR